MESATHPMNTLPNLTRWPTVLLAGRGRAAGWCPDLRPWVEPGVLPGAATDWQDQLMRRRRRPWVSPREWGVLFSNSADGYEVRLPDDWEEVTMPRLDGDPAVGVRRFRDQDASVHALTISVGDPNGTVRVCDFACREVSGQVSLDVSGGDPGQLACGGPMASGKRGGRHRRGGGAIRASEHRRHGLGWVHPNLLPLLRAPRRPARRALLRLLAHSPPSDHHGNGQ